MQERCPWCILKNGKNGDAELYLKYHDEEWGAPVHDDRKQFEFLVLESAQAGLSWLTVLRKRENYRKAYDNFEPTKVAKYGEKKVAELLNNAGIIRNRAKIEASINNAKRFLEIQKEFGSFDKYVWSFTGGKPIVNKWKNQRELPAKTELSDNISADMKKRGFKFMGSTVVYAHLQAVGIVNDHIASCFRQKECVKLGVARMPKVEIRRARAEDLLAITEIYNDAILKTTATFDTQTKTMAEQEKWFAAHDEKHPILVAETGGEIVGWASLSQWSDRCAYSGTVENSVYVSEKFRGKGIGNVLLEKSIDEGKKCGLHTVIARIASGNDISVKMHEKAGFKHIGVMKEVGVKFGKLLDVIMMQKIYD